MTSVSSLLRSAVTVAAVLLLAALVVTSSSTKAVGQSRQAPKIVVYGDSLATGLFLPRASGLVPRLQEALNRRGVKARLINRSRNGRTTTAGARSIRSVLRANPDGVIVILGGNDILKRVPLSRTRQNLDRMLSVLRQNNIPVLLTSITPARGTPTYRRDFPRVFASAARRNGALYMPNFYRPLAGRSDRKLIDNIHPNSRGVDALVANMLPKTIQLVRRAAR